MASKAFLGAKWGCPAWSLFPEILLGLMLSLACAYSHFLPKQSLMALKGKPPGNLLWFPKPEPPAASPSHLEQDREFLNGFGELLILAHADFIMEDLLWPALGQCLLLRDLEAKYGGGHPWVQSDRCTERQKSLTDWSPFLRGGMFPSWLLSLEGCGSEVKGLVLWMRSVGRTSASGEAILKVGDQ